MTPEEGGEQDRRDRDWQEDYYGEGSLGDEGKQEADHEEPAYQDEEDEQDEQEEENEIDPDEDSEEDDEKEFFEEDDITSLPVQALIETHVKPAKVFLAQQLTDNPAMLFQIQVEISDFADSAE